LKEKRVQKVQKKSSEKSWERMCLKGKRVQKVHRKRFIKFRKQVQRRCI